MNCRLLIAGEVKLIFIMIFSGFLELVITLCFITLEGAIISRTLHKFRRLVLPHLSCFRRSKWKIFDARFEELKIE